MSKSLELYYKRKVISSYFSVILSLTLILFLLGVLGFLILNTQKLGNYFKEQISMTISLKDDAKNADITQFQKMLSVADYTKNTTFISKDEAAESYSKELGEDFVSFIGTNPLKNSIDLSLKADYVTPEKMQELSDELKQKSFVEDVTYDKPLIATVHTNVERISLVILVASGLFTIVAILLINSSIRLSVYSKRFTIKTMQMVGATKGFIRRPFIRTNIRLGVAGALFAMLLLLLCLVYINQNYPELGLLSDYKIIGIVFGSILLVGIFISWISTFFAAQRFLNLHTDQLYY